MPEFPEVGLKAVVEGINDFERSAKIVEDGFAGLSQASEQTAEASGGASAGLGVLTGVVAGLTTAGIGIVVNLLSGLVGTLWEGVSAAPAFAGEIDNAMDSLQARTGAAGEELQQFTYWAEEIYKTGLGGTLQDAANAAAQAHQVFGATSEDLYGIGSAALALQDAMGVGVEQSMRAAHTATQAFGEDAVRVFDMITVSMQQTGDPSHDLLMAVNSFAPAFAEAGFSAEGMFSVLNAGVGAGAKNFKMVGDVVQEFFANLREGGGNAETALNELFSTPGDALSQLTGEMDSLNQTIADEESALVDTKLAMEEAKGAWGASQKVVKDLESALSEARAELEELSRPRLEGMEAFDNKIFELEQQIKKARLAMLDMEQDTPEFEAASQELEGLNKELEKTRLAQDIQYDAQFRALEQAVAAGTEEVMTFDEAMARIQGRKGDVAALEAALWEARNAEAAAGDEVERLQTLYDATSESLVGHKDRLAEVKTALEEVDTPAREFIQAFAEGAVTGPDAMSKVLQALRDIEDPLERARLGTAIFGTSWKNLGEDVLMAMDPATASLGDFEGATQEAGAALVSGLDGAWEKFTRTLKVSLGEGFMPILNTLGDKLGPALEGLMSWLEADGQKTLQAFGDAVGEFLGEVLAELVPFLEKKLMPALEDVAEWLQKEGIPWLKKAGEWLLKEGIPALVKIVKFLVEDVIPTLVKIVDRLADFVGAVQKMKSDVESAIDALERAWEAAWTAIQRVIETVWEIIVRVISDAMDEIRNTIATILSAIQDTVETIWNAIENTITTILNTIQNTVETVWGDIQSTITTIMSAIQNTIEDIWNAISNAISTVLSTIQNTIETVWNSIENTISTIMSAIQNTIETIWNDIQSTIATILSAIQSTVTTVWGDIQSTIATILGSIQTTVSNIWNDILSTITSILGSIQTAVSNIWGDILSTITSALTDIGSVISQQWNSFLSNIQTVLGDILTAVTTGFQNVYNEVRAKLESLAQIPAQISATLISIGTAVVNYIQDGIRNFVGFVQNVVSTLSGWISSVLTEVVTIGSSIYTSCINIGSSIVSRILNGISNFANSIGSFVANVSRTLRDWLDDLMSAGSSWIASALEVGSAIVNYICESIRDGVNDLWDALASVLNDALDAIGLGRPFPESHARAVGLNLAYGIARGVYDGSDAVARAAVWTVENALAAVQKATGVASPSRVFAALGEDLMRGFELGVAAHMPVVSAQLQAAVSAPALAVPYAARGGGGTVVNHHYHVGGNTINSGLDESIFEARVMHVIRRNMS